MATQITQSQYNTSKQTIRKLYIKVDLLNFDYMMVGSLEGNVISGSININANSDLRRSCNISLVVTDSTFEVEPGGKIWLDKLIRIRVGIDDIRTGDIAWTNMGMYMINQPSYSYDADTHILSFQGVDLVARLTGLRNGYVAALGAEDKVIIPVGQNVREAMIGVLNECNITRYFVSECKNVDGFIQPVPYDMEFEQGATWWDVIKSLRDILPSYQAYFDVDGVFIYEPIPTSAAEPVRIDLDTWEENVISENVTTDFQSVKNVVEVYGVVHDPQFFCDSDKATVSGNEINLTVSEDFAKTEHILIGFVLPSQATGNITINVNNTGAVNLVNSSGQFVTNLDADTYWVASYQADGTWLFLGHVQAQAVWQDTNPQSPFYVSGSIGEIRLPLYGGDYENIQSDELALERAKYEIYLRCRLNDSISVATVPIYYADVNWKVNYQPLKSKFINQYMIQSISIDLSPTGKQSFNMSRFYPLYPDLT